MNGASSEMVGLTMYQFNSLRIWNTCFTFENKIPG